MPAAPVAVGRLFDDQGEPAALQIEPEAHSMPDDEGSGRCFCVKRFLCGPGEGEPGYRELGSAAAPPLFPKLEAILARPGDLACRGLARCPCLRRPKCDEADGQELPRRARQVCYTSALTIFTLCLCIVYYYHQFAVDSAVPMLSCQAVLSRYKATKEFGKGKCGLNGATCKPWGVWSTYRCDGFCSQRGFASEPLIAPVIGSGPYRADSRLCMAAKHAGLIGEAGGCFDVTVGGPTGGFEASEAHGVTSLQFSSWYPLTLHLRPSAAGDCSLRAWPWILVLNVLMLTAFAALRPPVIIFWWTMLVYLFWYLTLAGNVAQVAMDGVMQQSGLFMLLLLYAYAVCWKLGNAGALFPDTSKGATLDVLLLELLPLVVTLHLQRLAVLTGDYDVNAATFQRTEGIMMYVVLALIIMPAIVYQLCRWRSASLLQGFCCTSLSGVVIVVALTLVFSTRNWGLHLHHYFTGTLGFLGFRGSSRVAQVSRALFMGLIINGICLWGDPAHLPIWEEGAGWFPPVGQEDVSGSGVDRVLFTGLDELPGGALRASWAFTSELERNCSSPAVDALDDTVFVLEMNHIEVYRGPGRGADFKLPEAADTAFIRLGAVSTGGYEGMSTISNVLAVHRQAPHTTVPWAAGATACERAQVILDQPRSSLAGFV